MGRIRKLTPQEKLLIGLILMLLVGIALRWGFIRRQAAQAFRNRFVPPAAQVDSLPEASQPLEREIR